MTELHQKAEVAVFSADTNKDIMIIVHEIPPKYSEGINEKYVFSIAIIDSKTMDVLYEYDDKIMYGAIGLAKEKGIKKAIQIYDENIKKIERVKENE